MQDSMHSRRGFLAALVGAIASLTVGWLPDRAAAFARPARAGHPDPRPGIDGSHVLGAGEVDAEVAELYDGIREIPQVVDGIRCYCGCDELEGFYSLLSCYEASGMAQLCDICQGEGRLVTRLHGEGRSLDEIRAAIDRRFA
ncbi:MAG: hypothetical protein ACREM1_01865 [Longimicrobiales bacterium]